MLWFGKYYLVKITVDSAPGMRGGGGVWFCAFFLSSEKIMINQLLVRVLCVQVNIPTDEFSTMGSCTSRLGKKYFNYIVGRNE